MRDDKLGGDILPLEIESVTRNRIFCGFGAVILLSYFMCAPLLTYWLRIILSPVVYGRSFYQIKILFLCASILCVAAPCSNFIPVPTFIRRYAVLIFSSSVIGLLILQVVSHMFVASKLELPPREYFVLVKDGVPSSSSIPHIHTGKAVMSTLLQWYSKNGTLPDGDSGVPFSYFLGPIFSSAMLVLFIAAVGGFLALVLSLFQNTKVQTAEMILFIFAGLMTLKAGIDGGVFSKGVPLYLAICIYISSTLNSVCRRALVLKAMPRLIGIAVSFSMLLSCAMFFNPLILEETLGKIFYFSFFSYLSPVLFLSFPILLREMLIGRKRVLSAPLFTLALVLWGISVRASSIWRGEHQYLQSRIPEGASVYYFKDSRATVLDTAVFQHDATLEDFYRTQRLRPGISNATVVPRGAPCPPEVDFSFDFKILEGALYPTVTPDWLTLTFSRCIAEQWCTFRVYGTLKNCAPPQTAIHSPTLNFLYQSGASLYAVRNFHYQRVGNDSRLLDDRA